ncbi:MAG: LuxR C-terminal-related transcriptional regulator [Candidatus Acidiferrales bacterium]
MVDKEIGVLVLCGNRLLRESIVHILMKRPDLHVLGAQPIGSTSRDEISKSAADVLVLDSLQFLLDGVICIEGSAADRRLEKCVLVAMEDDPQQFLTAIRHGALGYVLQEASAVDVVSAIRSVARGEGVCPPRMARVLFDYFLSQRSHVLAGHVRAKLGLTRREQQLVPLIGLGLTNKEIAHKLNLSEQTVKNHVHRILQKVGVDDRLEVFEACQDPLQSAEA